MNLEQKYKKAIELLDSCYNIVELWDCKMQHQYEWQQNWLRESKDLIDGFTEENKKIKSKSRGFSWFGYEDSIH